MSDIKDSQRFLHRAKSITDVIEELEILKEEYGEDIKVLFSYDYGDHWHSQVAQNIDDIDVTEVKYSSYHNMAKLVDMEEEEDENKQLVIVIR